MSVGGERWGDGVCVKCEVGVMMKHSLAHRLDELAALRVRILSIGLAFWLLLVRSTRQLPCPSSSEGHGVGGHDLDVGEYAVPKPCVGGRHLVANDGLAALQQAPDLPGNRPLITCCQTQ